MYERKATPKLKDIAENLNLSIGTVQRALNNKGGYSEETKQMIIKEAKRLGYIVNPAASALRRNPILIGVVLPVRKGQRRYYFDYIWNGILSVENELAAQNIHLLKYDAENGDEFYENLLLRKEIKGLITFSSTSRYSQELLSKLAADGVSVFIIDGDPNENLSRCGFTVRVPHQGNLAADIICRSVKDRDGIVLILGGSRKTIRQASRTLDFCNELQNMRPGISVMEMHMPKDDSDIGSLLRNTLLTLDNIVGIFSTSTLETLLMCKVVKETKLSGKLATVGMGVYEELLPYFNDGTLMATIYQNPNDQATMVIRNMAKMILSQDDVEKEIIIPASAVFRSVADDFVNLSGKRFLN